MDGPTGLGLAAGLISSATRQRLQAKKARTVAGNPKATEAELRLELLRTSNLLETHACLTDTVAHLLTLSRSGQ